MLIVWQSGTKIRSDKSPFSTYFNQFRVKGGANRGLRPLTLTREDGHLRFDGRRVNEEVARDQCPGVLFGAKQSVVSSVKNFF